MTREFWIANVRKQGVKHVIVYLDSGYAIHLTPSGVEITTLDLATKGRPIKWTKRMGLNLSDAEILQRAKWFQATKKYSAATYNCQDFKEELLGHPPKSDTRTLLLGVALFLGAWVALNKR